MNNTEWKTVPIGDLLEYLDERVELFDQEEYITITVKRRHGGLIKREILLGSQIKTKKQYKLCPGAFIISRVQCWHQAFAIVPHDIPDNMIASTNYDQFAIRPSVDPAFFWWLSQSLDFLNAVRDSAVGVVVEKVVFKRDQWLQKTIRIPHLLEEQRGIVTHIEAIAQRIEAARGLRQEAMRDADALFESAIDNLFQSYKTHECCSLKDLTTKIGSGSTPRGGRAVYLESGIPFVRSLNVRMRHFQYKDLAFIPHAIHERMRGTQLESGDVLLNITGASIGRVACFPDDISEGNVNQHVTIIRPRPERLSSRFLMYWLSQPKLQEYIDNKQKGGTRQGFTKAQIQAMEIPIIPLVKQRDIVATLDGLQSQISKLKDLQEQTQNDLYALLPSVLDSVFNGD